MASLFTARAISYRAHMGFDHLKVALSVGVQRMVRADTGASGVIFPLDPDTGHRGFVYVTAIFGLGENIVQGRGSCKDFDTVLPVKPPPEGTGPRSAPSISPSSA
jgi:phosphoenolpyruvate synthase/pyruvate phosphate dikinase